MMAASLGDLQLRANANGSLATYVLPMSQAQLASFLARLGYSLAGALQEPIEVAPNTFVYPNGLVIHDMTAANAKVKNYVVEGNAIDFYQAMLAGGWTIDRNAAMPVGLPALRGLPGTGDTLMFTTSDFMSGSIAARYRSTGLFVGPEEGNFKFSW
jgi:hypothetical protein